jgi:hypothetical protein
LLVPAMRASALPSPMGTNRDIGTASRVAEADLTNLWRHLNRLGGRNTSASHLRKALQEEISARRTLELEGIGVPEPYKNLMRRRCIFAWYPRLDDEDEDDDEEEEVAYSAEAAAARIKGMVTFRSWLMMRQKAWRRAWPNTNVHITLPAARARARAVRYTPGSAIEPLPTPVHWLEPHPQNHSAWLSDEPAAGLRHYMAETSCSGRSLPLAFALAFGIMFREAPPPVTVLSRTTLRHAFLRLHTRDVMDLGEFVRGVLDEYDAALLYHVFDDTPDGSCERHAHLLSLWDPEEHSPRFLFLSCKGTPDKSAEGNAAENMLNTALLGEIDYSRHGGCCCDHAALTEASTFAKLLSDAAARQHEVQFI